MLLSGAARDADALCEDLPPMFLIITGLAGAGLAAAALLEWQKRRRPREGVTNYGAPWDMALLLIWVSVQCVWPQAVYFAAFRFAAVSIPLARQSACTAVVNFPAMPLFFFLWGLAMVLLNSPRKRLVEAADSALLDDSILLAGAPTPGLGADGRHRVLFLGGVGRGLFPLERLRRETAAGGDARTETWVASYDAARAEHVTHNAAAAGLSNQLRLVTAGQGYDLPLGDASMDAVLVTPHQRILPPIGTYLAGEDLRRQGMAALLQEALRVLRPSGRVVCVDMARFIPLLAADVRDALRLDEEPEVEVLPRASHFNAGKWAAFAATKPALPTPVKTPVDEARDSPGTEGTALLATKPVPHSVAHAAAVCVHTLAYVALSFGACALYAPTDYPSALPANARFSSMLVSVATSLPIITYVARERVIAQEEYPTYAAVLAAALRTLGTSCVTAVVAVAVVLVPLMGVTALVVAVGASSAVATGGSLLFTVVLAVAIYKQYMRRQRTRDLNLRGLSTEKYMPLML